MRTFLLTSAAALLAGLSIAASATPPAKADPASQIERGRYLVKIGGCNDCHTVNYGETGGKVPQAQWLTGSPLGWSGPWGTTYAPNLRNYFSRVTADQWVKVAHTIETRPPMPWFVLRDFSEPDLRAMHAFIASLGAKGGESPAYLPPGRKASGPVVVFPEPPPGAAAGK